MAQWEQASKAGGETCDIEGRSTSAPHHPRKIGVKRYAGGEAIHVGIGPTTKKQYRASLELDPDTGEELAEKIYEACEAARRSASAKA